MATAIQAIYRDLEYANTLTRQRANASSTPFSPTADSTQPDAETDVGDIEDWTFIGDDSDMEFAKRARQRAVSDIENPHEQFLSRDTNSDSSA